MLSFFKKKAAKSEEAANGKTMKAYLTGKVIPIEEVNDGVFSAKIMGDGIAIIPENEVLTAPADGEITQYPRNLFPCSRYETGQWSRSTASHRCRYGRHERRRLQTICNRG